VKDIRRAKLWRTDHLTDVEQSFHTEVQLDECAKIQHAGDYTLSQLTLPIMLVHESPGIGLKHLETERNSLPLPIQTEHVNIHLVADLEDLAGMVNPSPTQFRNVDQAISPTQVHESAELGNAGDFPMLRRSHLYLFHNPLALQLLPGAPRPPLRENQAAATTIHFDNLEANLLPDHI